MSRYNTNRYNTNRKNTNRKNLTTSNSTQNRNRKPTLTSLSQNNIQKKSLPPSHELKSWMIIHTKAKYAVTKELRDEFVEYIKYLGVHYPCGKCRPHIKSYFNSCPIPDVNNNDVNDIDNNTIYKWAWNFHNTVNVRLAKPVYTWESAKRLYNTL